MREMHGEAGTAWLDRLPEILAECERRWSLRIEPAFGRLSYNYVAPAVRADGGRVVLKLGFPDAAANPEPALESAALRAFDGRGSVRLLEVDLDLGALLLERVEPGTPLAAVSDDARATSAAAAVMRHLWRPAPPAHSFPSVSDWIGGMERLRKQFAGSTGPFPAALVEEAEGLFKELLASMAEPVLLHGDLHHENILAAGREPWLAIDPKGVVGEPAYETGAFLRNRLDVPDPGRVTAGRVDQLSEELELDRARVRGWAVAQAVLSAWWGYEDHGRLEPVWIDPAWLLASLR